MSLAESYAVALTEASTLYIWGTTVDHFLGDNIGQSHFFPTHLSVCSFFAIETVFSNPGSLFIVGVDKLHRVLHEALCARGQQDSPPPPAESVGSETATALRATASLASAAPS